MENNNNQQQLELHMQVVRELVLELHENVKCLEVDYTQRTVQFYYDGVEHRARIDYPKRCVIIERLTGEPKHTLSFEQINEEYTYPVF